MNRSVHMPVSNESFEIYDFSGEENQARTNEWLTRHNDSAERFAQAESLFYLHTHDVMEIFLFLGGDCEFFCEGITYTLQPGDIVVVPPYAVHKAEVDDLNEYERMILNLSPQLLDDFMQSDGAFKKNVDHLQRQETYVTHLEGTTFTEVVSFLKKITAQIKMGEGHHTFTLHYLLFQALQHVFEPAPANPPADPGRDERLGRILAYVEENLTDPGLNLDNVSRAFHLNKYYFSHYFKQEMNLPFYRYVLLKRLSNAIALMKKDDRSLEQIAIRCGFSDYSSFYRVFKNVYNRSPKNMQTELRK